MEVEDEVLQFYANFKKLGKGAFGTVYSAIEKKTGKMVAIKSIENTQVFTTDKEIQILKQLDNPMS